MFILGDIHGYTRDQKTGLSGFETLKWFIETQIVDSNIIQVGDFGLTDNIQLMNRTLIELNRLLGESGNKLYVIRGNHDNPAFWNGTHIYEHLELVPDYETRIIEDKKILFIGGAISVDRKKRIKEGYPWWPDEVFVLKKGLLNTISGVDIVVTHTAPNFAYPQTLSGIPDEYTQVDSTLLQECARERLDMTEVYDILKSKNKIMNWAYGHYHTNEVTPYEGVEFRVVGVNDVYHLRTEAEYGN